MIAQSVGCSLGCSHSQLGKPVNPVVTRYFSLKRGCLRARLVAFLERVGPGKARAVDQDGHRPTPRRLRHEAAAAPAKGDIL